MNVQRSKSIGILCGDFGDPYSVGVVQSTVQTLISAGHSSVCLVGGFPDAPLYGALSRQAATFDGIVALSAVLRGVRGNLREVTKGGQFLISVGARIADEPSVEANDEVGVARAMSHLIEVHGRRRIAFIAAPQDSADGERRLFAYRQACEAFSLPLEPGLVVRGDYEAESGARAVGELLRFGPGGFDGLVAANDLMAMGAMEALRDAGRKVPKDVSVIGFDDTEEAFFARPRLTTVRQPVREEGELAGRLIVDYIEGRASRENSSRVNTPLVVRNSCGCFPESGRHKVPRPRREAHDDDGEETLRAALGKHLTHARKRRELTRVAGGLLAASTLPDLAQVMTEALPLLATRRMLLCTYNLEKHTSRVVLQSSGRDVVVVKAELPCSQLLPAGFLRSGKPTNLMVIALALADEQLGYLVLDTLGDAMQLELCRYLSAALGRLTRERELIRLYANTKRPPPA